MDRKRIAEKIAEESIVLLKNAGSMLPLKKGKTAAFFGRTQIDMLYSGNGSGSARAAGVKTILEACEEHGISAEPRLKSFYEEKSRTEPTAETDGFDWTKIHEAVNSGVMYEIFGKYRAPLEEYEVPEALIAQAAGKTDTAIFVLGRNSGGEECDRHLPDDYELTQKEKRLLEQVCAFFPKVAVILNVNGLIDLAWTEQCASIKSLLFVGIPGEEGASALARILVGEVNPSGKLAVTAAERYEDYPSSEHFSWDKEHPERVLSYEDYGLSAEENGSIGFSKSPVSVYWEDIYNGYRYFDTFGKRVLYPFGYGLSYTAFALRGTGIKKSADGIRVTAEVENTGKLSGRETVQVYLSRKNPEAEPERPFQELKGFEKTPLLSPREAVQLELLIPWREFAVYDEERAAWSIEAGAYLLRVGNSSRSTFPAGTVLAEETILVEQCENRLQIAECNRGKVEFLTQRKQGGRKQAETAPGEDTPEDWKREEHPAAGSVAVLRAEDLRIGRGKADASAECEKPASVVQTERKRSLSEFSIEELASLCVGYGPGTPFAAVGDCSDPPALTDAEGTPLTTNSHPAGYPGYVSPAIPEKGICSVFYKDGPAGVGGIAWPTEMLIACSFDRALWRLFGDAVGQECEAEQVNVWLAPAVNLHRNPLCGRNFEYFSEDPFLTGVCACEIAAGVQKQHPVLVCPKHFAANEQETFRRGSLRKNTDAADSILTERAARELYLKPFEMLVKDGNIACIMTSFNRLNGRFAGGNQDLCTHILREEWGFNGAVVTDWGDMDVVVDGADAVAAGNDIVMPGGPPVIRQILEGYREGRVTRDALERAVCHFLTMIDRTGMLAGS